MLCSSFFLLTFVSIRKGGSGGGDAMLRILVVEIVLKVDVQLLACLFALVNWTDMLFNRWSIDCVVIVIAQL